MHNGFSGFGLSVVVLLTSFPTRDRTTFLASPMKGAHSIHAVHCRRHLRTASSRPQTNHSRGRSRKKQSIQTWLNAELSADGKAFQPPTLSYKSQYGWMCTVCNPKPRLCSTLQCPRRWGMLLWSRRGAPMFKFTSNLGENWARCWAEPLLEHRIRNFHQRLKTVESVGKKAQHHLCIPTY